MPFVCRAWLCAAGKGHGNRPPALATNLTVSLQFGAPLNLQSDPASEPQPIFAGASKKYAAALAEMEAAQAT